MRRNASNTITSRFVSETMKQKRHLDTHYLIIEIQQIVMHRKVLHFSDCSHLIHYTSFLLITISFYFISLHPFASSLLSSFHSSSFCPHFSLSSSFFSSTLPSIIPSPLHILPSLLPILPLLALPSPFSPRLSSFFHPSHHFTSPHLILSFIPSSLPT